MSSPLRIAKKDATELFILPAMANRHGRITGATGRRQQKGNGTA